MSNSEKKLKKYMLKIPNTKISTHSMFLILIIILGFILRVWGINFGLPDLYGPAEFYTVNNAVSYGGGSLEPLNFAHPPLLSYIIFILYGFYFIVGYILGSFASVHQYAVQFFLNPSPFYLIGRFVSAFIGTLTILLTYVLGKKVFNRKIALLGSLFMAIAFVHIGYSHYIRPDILMVLLIVVTIIFVIKYFETGKIKYSIFSGFFTGLAVMAKYPAIILAFSIFIAHTLLFIKEKAKTKKKLFHYSYSLILACLFIVAGMFIGSPYTFLDFSSFWRDFRYVMFGSVQVPGTGNFLANVNSYFSFLLSSEGLGFMITLTAILGFFIILTKLSNKKISFLSFPIIFFIVLILSPFKFWYILPIIPFICLLASYCILTIINIITKSKKIETTLLVTISVVMILLPLYSIILFDYKISQKDTRTIAREWVAQNIPEGTKLLVDNYGPQLRENRDSLSRRWKETSESDFEQEYERSNDYEDTRSSYRKYMLEALRLYKGKAYDVTHMRHAYWKSSEYEPDLEIQRKARNIEISPRSLEYYKENNYEYFLTSSFQYDRYFTENGLKNFPSTFNLYNSIFNDCELVREFKPGKFMPGPTVRIYRII